MRDFVTPCIQDIVVSVDHVGSTSVPGLLAKPIVDLDVVVGKREQIRTAIERLAVIGYVHEGDLGVEGRETFKSPTNLPPHHLYLLTQENTAYKRHIMFRDDLRSHPRDAKMYGDRAGGK